MKAHPTNCRTPLPARVRATLLAFIALTAPTGFAGNFGVAPIRLDLDRTARTGSLTVTNDAADKPLRVQLEAFSWLQDASGKDLYEPTAELTFLPRSMSIEPKEQRLVRAGIRLPAAEREKAYRLFIEEVPEPRKPGEAGAQVAVKVRFGIPVFVKPLKEEPKGEIDKVDLDKGTLAVTVRNTGNVHFIIQSVQLKAGELFSKELPGWYLLPGAARAHLATIPADVCVRLGGLDVTVKTDRLELARRVEVDQALCR
jgi:fimbrial chaperone protein